VWVDGKAVEGYPRLLTVTEYLALGEVEPGYTELFEGRVLLTPTPSVQHARALTGLWSQLRPQLPAGFEGITGVDVDLELAPADAPGFSRRPDLVVVRHDAGRDDVIVRVSEVVVAVEIASSASQRTDRVAKRSDYAAAGIPHYWIVDLDPLSVLECRLGADGAYADQGAVTGAFRTLEPFAIEVDLDALV